MSGATVEHVPISAPVAEVALRAMSVVLVALGLLGSFFLDDLPARTAAGVWGILIFAPIFVVGMSWDRWRLRRARRSVGASVAIGLWQKKPVPLGWDWFPEEPKNGEYFLVNAETGAVSWFPRKTKVPVPVPEFEGRIVLQVWAGRVWFADLRQDEAAMLGLRTFGWADGSFTR